jgi:hypothetical protein
MPIAYYLGFTNRKRKYRYIEEKTRATLKSKQASIATVQNHLRTPASFPTPLIFHWSLPLNKRWLHKKCRKDTISQLMEYTFIGRCRNCLLALWQKFPFCLLGDFSFLPVDCACALAGCCCCDGRWGGARWRPSRSRCAIIATADSFRSTGSSSWTKFVSNLFLFISEICNIICIQIPASSFTVKSEELQKCWIK